MSDPSPSSPSMLDTSAGPVQLREYKLRQAGREWTILHTGAVLTFETEQKVIGEKVNRLPYGVALWPSAIALAHEVATRSEEFGGRSVLELGAGTGLPGIVAATTPAQVTQTERDELALHLCRSNGERNRAPSIQYHLADWTTWEITGKYDWIIGADILYGESLHPHLRPIFANNLAPGGRILLADPFRSMSLRFLETLEAEGWKVSYNQWDVGEETEPRPVAVFEVVPPNLG